MFSSSKSILLDIRKVCNSEDNYSIPDVILLVTKIYLPILTDVVRPLDSYVCRFPPLPIGVLLGIFIPEYCINAQGRNVFKDGGLLRDSLSDSLNPSFECMGPLIMLLTVCFENGLIENHCYVEQV